MDAKDRFRAVFAAEPTLFARAPGRVNLIGEHTDYNQGFVLPVAIDRAMYIAACPNDDAAVHVHSMQYEQDDSFSVEAISWSQHKQWSNYLRGVVATMRQAGYKVGGFDAVLSGDVPQGAGLSSSAAYEVAVAALINQMFGFGLDRRQLALLSQKSENEFIGVRCGIMDQFISSLAETDSALLIDCRSLEFRAINLNLEQAGVAILITNSGVARGLVDSEYNTRRSECEAGTNQLAQLLDHNVHSLRDVTSDDLSRFAPMLPAVVGKRCRHVVSENERVLKAASALERDDLRLFGELMNQSHTSLRDDFQVSCPELDELVELTQSVSGCYGTRMTGAGFGGCTVTLMSKGSVSEFAAKVGAYQQRTDRKIEIYICRAEAGVSVEPCLKVAT